MTVLRVAKIVAFDRDPEEGDLLQSAISWVENVIVIEFFEEYGGVSAHGLGLDVSREC